MRRARLLARRRLWGEGDDASCDCAEGATKARLAKTISTSAAPNLVRTQPTVRTTTVATPATAAPLRLRRSELRPLALRASPEDFIAYDVSPEGGVVVGANTNTLAYKYVGGEDVFLGFLIGDNASAAYGASADGESPSWEPAGPTLYDTSRAVRWDGPDVTLWKKLKDTLCKATE